MEITTKGTTAAKNSFKNLITTSVFVWQNYTTSHFSISIKFETIYITGEWGEFKLNTLCYVFIYFFGFFMLLLLFFIIRFLFLSFSFFFFDEVSNFNNRILINQNFKRLFKEASEHYLCKKLSLMSSSKLCTWINHVSKYRCIKVLLP